MTIVTALSYILTFMAGSLFGAVTMACFAAAGREDRARGYSALEGDAPPLPTTGSGVVVPLPRCKPPHARPL